MSGNCDFSLIETIMLMYPTILWLDLMKCDPNYLTTELLKGFTFKAHCAGLYMSNTTSTTIATTVPTWESFVGPTFKNGIQHYVTTDATPSPVSLMPSVNVDQRLEGEEKEEEIQESLDKTGHNLVSSIEDLLEDVTAIKNQQSAFDVTFTVEQRVCVDHLICIITNELQIFSKTKVKARLLHRFPIVWKMSMYFHNIFLLLGHYVRDKYELLISNDEIVRKVLLSNIGEHNEMKAYMCNTVTHLSEAIAAAAPKAYDKGVDKRNADPRNSVQHLKTKELLRNMKKFNIIKKAGTPWPTTQYVKHVESVRKAFAPGFTLFTKFPFGLTASHLNDPADLATVHPDLSPDSQAYLNQISTTNTVTTNITSSST